jgi:hypothetical protein
MTTINVSIQERPVPRSVVIRFTGHITRDGYASGLPETIFAFLITQDCDMTTINKLIEDQVAAFVRSQGMFVQREQGKILDLRMSVLDGMLVPFHNIAYIDVELVNMAGELLVADENGVERLLDGSEPLKQ